MCWCVLVRGAGEWLRIGMEVDFLTMLGIGRPYAYPLCLYNHCGHCVEIGFAVEVEAFYGFRDVHAACFVRQCPKPKPFVMVWCLPMADSLMSAACARWLRRASHDGEVVVLNVYNQVFSDPVVIRRKLWPDWNLFFCGVC